MAVRVADWIGRVGLTSDVYRHPNPQAKIANGFQDDWNPDLLRAEIQTYVFFVEKFS